MPFKDMPDFLRRVEKGIPMSGNTGGKQIDMLHGPMAGRIFLFAMPIAATSILQQLFNAADVAVVGQFAGSSALAAVGSNSPVISFFVNIIVGLAVGATAVASRLVGLQRKEEMQQLVQTVVLFALLAGFAVLAVGEGVASPLLQLLGTPENVLSEAVLYLRIYLLGMPVIVVYNFLAAILRSVGDSRRPLYVLVASGVVNVGLNLLLVIVFHMGVAGVAIATVVSNLISTGILWVILMREDEMIRLEPKKLRIHRKQLLNILKIGAPASLQSSFFTISNLCMQAGINSLGSAVVAGTAVAQNYMNISFFIVQAYDQAAVAFTGQNYGAGQYDRCRRVLGISLLESILTTGVWITAVLLLRYPAISLFTSDAQVIPHTLTYLFVCLLPHSLVCVYETLGSYMRALEHSLLPAMMTVVGSVIFRILWLNTVFVYWPDYGVLMSVYPISWIVTILLMVLAYLSVRKKIFPAKSA